MTQARDLRLTVKNVKVSRLTRIRQSDLEAWLRLGLQPGRQEAGR